MLGIGKLVSRELTMLTPKLADKLLPLNRFEHQRSICPKRLANLERVMKEGLFTDAAIIVASNGSGQDFLLNGQHCSTGVRNTGISVNITLLQYACKDKAEMSHLFRQIDDGMNTRSILEVLNVERNIIGKGYWLRTTAPLLVTAVSLLEIQFANMGNARMSRDRKAEILTTYMEVGDFIDNIVGASTRDMTVRFLRRGSVVAAMIKTYQKRKHSAQIFWEQVRDGIGLNRNSPQLRLRNYLMAITLQGKGQNRQVFVKCIHAWNAYVTNSTTDLRYLESAKMPIVR